MRLSLLGQPSKNLPKVLPQLFIEHFAAALRNESDVIFYTPTWSGLGFHTRPSGFSTNVCLAAHAVESPRWTPGNVKQLLPPRQSRGSPAYARWAALELVADEGNLLSKRDKLTEIC
jgi:hypothetical protein